MKVNDLNKKFIFNDFPAYKTAAYSSALNSSNKNGNEKPDNTAAASVTIGAINKKHSRKNILTATVGTSILAAGTAGILLNKGFSSSSYRKITEMIEVLNEQIDSGSKGKKAISSYNKITLIPAKIFRKTLSILKAGANFSAIKDSGADIVARKTKVGTKIVDSITNVFKKFATQTVDVAYDKVHISTDYFLADLDRILKNPNFTESQLAKTINIKGSEKTLEEWLKTLSFGADSFLYDMNSGFGKSERVVREGIRENALSDLDKKVQDAIWRDHGGIFNLRRNGRKFKSYITEDLAQDGKVRIRNRIIEAKNSFSNNIDDNFSMVRTNMREITDKLALDDNDSIGLLKIISKKMVDYRNLSGVNEAAIRESLVQEIEGLFTQFTSGIQASPRYSEDLKNSIMGQVKFISGSVLQNSKKGSLQELLTIIRGLSNDGIIDPELSKSLFEQADKISKQINKASLLEADDLYDKYAEFKVGSAPNDVLGLIFPLGVAAVAVSSAENKNKKVSTVLTTGIPIMGTIVSMVIGTAKMITGVKNLAMGAGIGFALNLVGNSANKLYLEYQKKQSFAQIAIDAYNNNQFSRTFDLNAGKKTK